MTPYIWRLKHLHGHDIGSLLVEEEEEEEQAEMKRVVKEHKGREERGAGTGRKMKTKGFRPTDESFRYSIRTPLLGQGMACHLTNGESRTMERGDRYTCTNTHTRRVHSGVEKIRRPCPGKLFLRGTAGG